MQAAESPRRDESLSVASDHFAHERRVGEPADDYAFLLGTYLDQTQIELALAEAERLGVAAARVILARSWVSAADYAAAFAADVARTIDTAALSGREARLIDATATAPALIRVEIDRALEEGLRPLLVDRAALEFALPASVRRRRLHRAANRLRQWKPEASAGVRMWTWQLIALVSTPGLIAGGMLVLPQATLTTMTAIAAVPFVFVVAMRLVALMVMLAVPGAPRPVLAAPSDGLDEAGLPTYAVLVPLYNEAEVLPGLVEALAALDYPVEKLDIALVLEASDAITRAAADQLVLPRHMRVVLVPEGPPRTKPKALNYALAGVSSDYVVVYDAEDLPDADQLRKAAAAFERGGPTLVCLQAQLTIDNPRASWLARQFTLEYAALFGGLLPALAWLGMPIPLGGTSNHFRRRALDALGAWDAHNVTEDADLGMRIARSGCRVDVLWSETQEEAPAQLGVWLRQRTRWQKGFMQTWAVHMRRPYRAFGQLGPFGFIGVNAVIGGHVVSALLHPFCLTLVIYAAWGGSLWRVPLTSIETVVVAAAVFNLAFGYVTALVLAAVAVMRQGRGWLVPHLLLTPVYWLLVSAAAWRALWQLARDPYRWEKTPHAARPGTRQRDAAGPPSPAP